MNTQRHVFCGAEGWFVSEAEFDRVSMERDALQQLLNARDEEISDLLEENRLMTNANAACGQELVRLRAKLTEYQSLLCVSSELLKTINMHTAMSPSQWCDSFQREVKDRIQKVDAALENQA